MAAKMGGSQIFEADPMKGKSSLSRSRILIWTATSMQVIPGPSRSVMYWPAISEWRVLMSFSRWFSCDRHPYCWAGRTDTKKRPWDDPGLQWTPWNTAWSPWIYHKPEEIVDYFSVEAEAAMKSIGFSIDWRRKFTTITPHYKKFITWSSISAWKKQGGKGSHPVRWCPNDQNPVEDHDIFKRRGRHDNWIYSHQIQTWGFYPACATLDWNCIRGHELWVNPKISHVKITVGGENG